MRRLHKKTKVGNELEASFWIDWRSWSFPLQIQWRVIGRKRKIPKGHLRSIAYVSVQFLCFIMICDFWVWGTGDVPNDGGS